ncbi:unnamed protein product [Medioppia subpectinata]|uniref:Uncharacterized protein n=1 Tax=Medioppia subpectinata TaxID=1979941 RepID=A0A7R9KQ29_9ACAR|nr:unnamed protein product [Medioppia subpectinata]CAG2107430.1 unnamed protein product [Medioppia subpectinata]
MKHKILVNKMTAYVGFEFEFIQSLIRSDLRNKVTARYLKKVAKLESCKGGDTSIHPHHSNTSLPIEEYTQTITTTTTATTPTTTCPTIASALWRPLWPPGITFAFHLDQTRWHPRGSTKTYRSNINLPVIKMSGTGGEAEQNDSSTVEYFVNEELEQMEDWLDEHPVFVEDYFVRKASRSLIDNWLLAHSAPVSAVQFRIYAMGRSVNFVYGHFVITFKL